MSKLQVEGEKKKTVGIFLALMLTPKHPVQSCENVSRNILTAEKWPVLYKETKGILPEDIHVSKKLNWTWGEWQRGKDCF